MVTDGHRLSQMVTDCHRWSQIVTDCHRLSQIVTDCHRLSQIVTDCQIVTVSQSVRERHRVSQCHSVTVSQSVMVSHIVICQRLWQCHSVTDCHVVVTECWPRILLRGSRLINGYWQTTFSADGEQTRAANILNQRLRQLFTQKCARSKADIQPSTCSCHTIINRTVENKLLRASI